MQRLAMNVVSRAAFKLVGATVACCAVTLAGAQGIKADGALLDAPAPAIAAAVPSANVPQPRFKEDIEAFQEADKKNAPKRGGVLFVGSSTIRFWNTLEAQFDKLPVVLRRGFGGSRMSDCTYYLRSLVTPYKPHLVVVYAGDNDLNEGATPQDVLKSYSDFVDGVRHDLPDTRIAFVSIKPSPSRENIIPAIIETNRLVKNYSRTKSNLDYIDVFTAMMASDGEPRNELFGPDALHMNDAGYALWKTILDPHIQ